MVLLTAEVSEDREEPVDGVVVVDGIDTISLTTPKIKPPEIMSFTEPSLSLSSASAAIYETMSISCLQQTHFIVNLLVTLQFTLQYFLINSYLRYIILSSQRYSNI